MRRQSGPMLFERHKCLLALLEALGGRTENVDFQKLLFLFCQERQNPNQPPAYEFVPYKFGAFSFTSYADRRTLIERGLLRDDDHTWELTSQGQQVIAGTRVDRLRFDAFTRKYRGLRGNALVAETYRRYPYYAIRSEIAQRILRDDKDTLQRIEAARPGRFTAPLSTIGYEGRTLENYLNQLLKSGVSILCDVRRNPISRKYGFSKSTLSKGCEGVGIRYEHLPELGIASQQRKNLETQKDYDDLFEIYKRDCLPRQKTALVRIYDWIRKHECVALTCYERLPQKCHRHCVAEVLEQASGGVFPIPHDSQLKLL